MKEEEKVVKEWFMNVLTDFLIYVPLYKITVTQPTPRNYTVVGEVEKGCIEADNIWVNLGEVIAWNHPVMYRKGKGNRELAQSEAGAA